MAEPIDTEAVRPFTGARTRVAALRELAKAAKRVAPYVRHTDKCTTDWYRRDGRGPACDCGAQPARDALTDALSRVEQSDG